MLRLEEICVHLGRFRLHSASLHVRRGEYLVLLGPTGTGKTVLLETIAGIHRPHRGRIRINGRDVTREPPERRQLGVVYQDYALFPHLNVERNIAFGLVAKGGKSGAEVAGAVRKMAAFFDIAHLLKRRPAHLSGGERQRVALARALVMEPFVLLLDEPLSALDRFTRDRIKRELKRIHQQLGVTILHITHDLGEAFFLADRLAVMKGGTILQEDLPEAVLQRPRSRSVAELVGIRNLLEAVPTGGCWNSSLGPLDLSSFAPDLAGVEKPVLLTIPDWNVELFPDESDNDYFWRGNLSLAHIQALDGFVELELEHAAGARLVLSLSRREHHLLSPALEKGSPIPTAIRRQGIHCVVE